VSSLEVFLDAANVLLPVAYLLAAVAYGFLFFTGNPLARRLATPVLCVTVLIHLVTLVGVTLRWRQLPAVTVSQALSVVAFAVAAVYLFVEWHGRERSTGFWMVSMVGIFQLLASMLHRPEPPDRELFHSPIFATHVSLALLGYAAFVVSAAYGFLFLRLYGELKDGRFTTFFGRLPPLEVLERMMAGALAVGFAALTGAVGTGVVWAQRNIETAWILDPKIAITFAVWALYGLALVLRRTRRWQGRQTALASLTGLGVILFSLLAVNLLFTDFHGFL
jgi:ABC-type transport system involved in cytochrome c biogenesis permease subunit